MASPGGREVGRVSIRALPDTSKFATELHAYLERIERSLELELPVSLDARTVAQTEAELAALTRDRSINIELNTQALAQNVSGVTRGLARWAPLILAASFAIGAVVAALPALVLNVGAPLAAIALGFDGVKESASGLKDEVESLRGSLSGTFEQLLTPGFERLGELFPSLTRGLDEIAVGVSQMFDSFSRAVTTQEAMGTIEGILTRIGDSLSEFAALGGVSAFSDSLLLLADAGTKATEALTPEFAAAFRQFNDELERLTANGDLQKGMEGFGHAILFMAAALEVFVLGGIIFLAKLERMGEEIHTFATETVPNAWESLKSNTESAFNDLIDRTSDQWDEFSDLAAAKPEEIAAYFRDLPGELQDIGAAAIQGLWDGFMEKWEQFSSWLDEKAQEALGTFGFIWDVQSPSKEFRKLGRYAGEGLQLGFEDSMKGVEDSAALMATSSLRAASGPSFLPDDFAGRGAGVEVTQVINPQPGQSETEIGKAAASRLLFVLEGAGG